MNLISYKNSKYIIIKYLGNNEYLCQNFFYGYKMIIKKSHMKEIKYKENQQIKYNNNICIIDQICLENNKIYYNVSLLNRKDNCLNIFWKILEEELSPIK